MKELHSKNTDTLFDAILSLKTKDECYAFFEDICTIKEIKDMSQRLEVAMLLRQGNSYQKVSDTTKASSATVGRVKRCLDYGSGGYSKIISRLEKK